MERRIKTAFLALVLTQIAHSIEEYAFQFYAAFPPARFLNKLLPGFSRPGFVVFNLLLDSFGLWCFFFRVRSGSGSARKWVWLWVGIEFFNGFGHPIWSILAHAYVPGLATSVLLLGFAAYLLLILRPKHKGAHG